MYLWCLFPLFIKELVMISLWLNWLHLPRFLISMKIQILKTWLEILWLSNDSHLILWTDWQSKTWQVKMWQPRLHVTFFSQRSKNSGQLFNSKKGLIMNDACRLRNGKNEKILESWMRIERATFSLNLICRRSRKIFSYF